MTDLRKRNDELLAALEAAHTREAIAGRQLAELQQDFDALKAERDALKAEALEVVSARKLDELLRQSAAAYAAMSPEEKAAHDEAQRQSWIRSMAPCEHGVRDWESCPDCIAKHGGTDAE